MGRLPGKRPQFRGAPSQVANRPVQNFSRASWLLKHCCQQASGLVLSPSPFIWLDFTKSLFSLSTLKGCHVNFRMFSSR